MAVITWAILGSDGKPKGKPTEFPPTITSEETLSLKITVDQDDTLNGADCPPVMHCIQGQCEAFAYRNSMKTSTVWNILAKGNTSPGLWLVSRSILDMLGVKKVEVRANLI